MGGHFPHLDPSSYDANGSCHYIWIFTLRSVLLAVHQREFVQGKTCSMRTPLALSMAAAVFAVFSTAGSAQSQEAIPDTPPELRDFRLDPERAVPKAQPEPVTERPVVTPPPVVSTTPERAPVAPRTTERRPVDEIIPVTPQESALPEAVPPETLAGVSEPEEVNSSPPLSALPDDRQPPEPAANANSFTAIGIAIGLLGILLLAWYWFRRRRSTDQVGKTRSIQRATPPEPDQNVPPPKPVPPIAVQTKANKHAIALDFMPEKATVSFNTLTVRGQLRIINESGAPALGMELRAGLISASAGHLQAIEAFHASAAVKAQSLGDARASDRIAMAIELSVPLGDMESFNVGEQKLLVPIMVASLSYRGGDPSKTETVHYACMIGREANPPVPKMGPLRLDLGPRSFSPLGQRPIYA